MKFKVGDRVEVVNESICHHAKVGMTGEIVDVTRSNYGVRFDKPFPNGHSLDGVCERGCGQWLSEDDIKLIGDNQRIVITSDGKTTLARLYEGKEVVKSAEANCSPDDEFDFTKGAKIAFEMLIGDKPKEKPKYYSGKVVCVESEYSWWTAGKVYTVMNGEVFDDYYDNRIGIHDVSEMNSLLRGSARFIELKE